MGAFRIYDLTNRSRPRLVQQCRFFEDSTPITNIKASPDGKLVLISSNDSNNIIIMSQRGEEEYNVYGFIQFCANVLSACFINIDGVTRIVAVLSNNLLAGADAPTEATSNRMEPIPDREANPAYRKIDKGCVLAIANWVTGDIYITGDDKLLKKYDYPTELLMSIDFKRVP